MAIDLLNDSQLPLPINEEEIITWISHTLRQLNNGGDICVCFVDENTMSNLNGRFRNKPKPTNVLSFPSKLPKQIQNEINLLGDMVICPPVLATEAIELNKPLRDHWAHICVHGTLHLLGYDHIEENDAKIMQVQETHILTQLNIPNPYSETEGVNLEH